LNVAEFDAVARMAGFWNIPIIAYMTASNSLTDKNIYKTLSRISMRSTNSFAEATAALLNHYKWLKVALVTNTGSVAYERVTSFEEVFAIRGISVVKRIMFDENADSAAMRSTGLIHELRNNARIIICVFSSTRQQSREFMSATSSERLQAKEFVFILPWLQDGSRDASPWVGPDGEMQQKIKDQYANAIIVRYLFLFFEYNTCTIVGGGKRLKLMHIAEQQSSKHEITRKRRLPGLRGLARRSNVCNVVGHNARVSVRTGLALIDATPLARQTDQRHSRKRKYSELSIILFSF
uniref:ANF_receptor domain-containing protein n=1 Tax=Anisakis simplex TaxID=6269 RepID=A0A0M3J6Z3_ANISI